MGFKRQRSFQTKLGHVTSFVLCPKCSASVYKRLYDLHAQECGLQRPASPARSVPETSCSDSPRSDSAQNAIDVIMSTLQVTVKDHFHLQYIGFEEGRHRWHWSFTQCETPAWVSSPKFLRISPTDPSCISLTLSTNLPPSSFDNQGIKPLPGFPRAMMLSILQKNIRRQRRIPTLHTAMQIVANLGFTELARRLCVIDIEETVLHPDYPVLAWAMAAGNHYSPPQVLYDSVLQIAADIASIPVRDVIDIYGPEPCFQQWTDALPEIKALLMRSFYRGMSGDIRMLQGYAERWQQRFLSNPSIFNALKLIFYALPSVSAEEKGGMRFADVLPAAIDNGVSNAVRILYTDSTLMKEVATAKGLAAEEVMDYLISATWDNRSGVNLRKSVRGAKGFREDFEPLNPPVFDEFFLHHLEPRLDRISTRILEDNFQKSS